MKQQQQNVRVEGNGCPADGGFTLDGSVDLKGKPILRSRRGGWRACSFILGYEVFESFTYYGIATILMVYLTTQLHQDTVSAANNVTNWLGTVFMAPTLGAYVADAHLGRYWTSLIASIIYLTGTCLLTLSVTVPSLKPSSCKNPANTCNKHAQALQIGVFFLGLYTVAAGIGGTRPNISTMGADQFDNFEPRERKQKLSFFNWWTFTMFFGTLLANTFFVFIQGNFGWSIGYGLLMLSQAVSILVFLFGTPIYRHKKPSDSPLAKMTMVLVAATTKWRVTLPRDLKELHELDEEEYGKIGKSPMNPTSSLLFLNKAAVRIGPSTSWTLCTVTQVEETKQMIKMLPIFLASFFPSTITAQAFTIFIKQGTTLDRSIGPHFKIPPTSLMAFINISVLISLVVYDKCVVPTMRKYTKNPRGITMLQRMGTGIVLHIIIMTVAGLVERGRLSYVKNHGLQNSQEPVPLTIFILLPQFVLRGIADAFTDGSRIEFFYDQAPQAMKSMGASYFTSCIGLGSFFSSFLLKAVSSVTESHGHGGWIRNNLNNSHLDYYYDLLAILSALNFIYFLIVSKHYVYRTEPNELVLDLNGCSGMKTNKTCVG